MNQRSDPALSYEAEDEMCNLYNIKMNGAQLKHPV